jgi:hypothetical protein
MADLKSPDFAPPAPVSPITAPAPKRPAIPRAVHQAIELIATGRVKTIQSAAERIGWERSRLSKRLSRPECIEAMKARAAKEVALGSGRAAARLNELIDGPSAKVALEATKFSLQTAGIGPVRDPNVNINLGMPRAGYVISLEERPERREIVDGKLVITPVDDGKVIEGEVIVGPKPVDTKPK